MAALDRRAEQVRAFNRFYTRQIGLLDRGYLESPLSLTEMRVLYELANSGPRTASALCDDLGLDAGYASRILRGFEGRGWIRRSAADGDARQSILSLTRKGLAGFAPFDKKAHDHGVAMLGKLAARDQIRMTEAMQIIEQLLGDRAAQKPKIVVRPHRPGDIGWVIHRHGALYAQEYGWDERFEALVAEIAARFVQEFDAERERCWIAEMDGEIAGSIFLVKKSKSVAKLRLLLVEPWARGSGIGTLLVGECIGFAREAGYKKITLWTQSGLDAARRIYERAGFRRVKEEPGPDLAGGMLSQTWELML
jgi:DNA-binding MarR family transcriptional regulator/N-acetylglutamate synthase-like GNAT family acetyltransferase